ncbi:hypothetical protein O6H91_18G015000 [Diphasiastrum complanatum]|uniref:Uncharacterized protein n=1 Tax=Diphasiastrum complanatum TaxID=34168 RepID=A0ACC2AYA5_DIPCM|nr:hypothetical protein O6H91_18G015000 [Diphasiastrum complanatum]
MHCFLLQPHLLPSSLSTTLCMDPSVVPECFDMTPCEYPNSALHVFFHVKPKSEHIVLPLKTLSSSVVNEDIEEKQCIQSVFSRGMPMIVLRFDSQALSSLVI